MWAAVIVTLPLAAYVWLHPPRPIAHYDCYLPKPGYARACLGVELERGANAYRVRDLVSGRAWEVHICPSFKAQLHAGYALSEFHTIETGPCERLDPDRTDLYYTIVRGDDREWAARYGNLTHSDPLGAGRPVLANNCANDPNDTDDRPLPTICTGGAANFNQEIGELR